MIPVTLKIFLILFVICYFIVILYYLKKRMLDLKYTLVWIFVGLLMFILVLFPELLIWFIHLFGIQSNMNGLFLMCIGFCFMLLMMLTAIVSRTSFKIRTLVQEISMLDKRVRELEKQLSDKNDGEV